jgi:hypothetical protein
MNINKLNEDTKFSLLTAKPLVSFPHLSRYEAGTLVPDHTFVFNVRCSALQCSVVEL